MIVSVSIALERRAQQKNVNKKFDFFLYSYSIGANIKIGIYLNPKSPLSKSIL